MYRNQARDLLGDPTATEADRAEAQAYLNGQAIPEPLPRHRPTDPAYWPREQMLQWGRDTGRIDEQGRPVKLREPPPSFVPRRQSFAHQLQRLQRVPLTDEEAARVEPLLTDACAHHLRDGCRIWRARERAIADVAVQAGLPVDAVRKAFLQLMVRQGGIVMKT